MEIPVQLASCHFKSCLPQL